MLDLFLPLYFFIYVLGYFNCFLFSQLKEIHLLTLEHTPQEVSKKVDEKLKHFTPSLYMFFPMFFDGSKTIFVDIYNKKDSKLVISDIEKFSETLFATKSDEVEKEIKKNFVKKLLHLE